MALFWRRQWQPTLVLLPGKSHWQRSLVGCSPWGHQQLDTTERLHFHFSLSCIGEGNGNPLQCSCLENPRDGGAWWAAVYGVAQSRTRPKWLSSSKGLFTCRNHQPPGTGRQDFKWWKQRCARDRDLTGGFLGSSAVNNLPADAGDTEDVGSNPGLERSSGRGHINPLQYSCLESPMGRGAWRATVQGVTKSRTRLSN